MYLRRGINPWHILRESWLFLVIVGAWSVLIVYAREFLQIEAVGLPIAPVTTIGIAVSLYLGFKSTSAYNRWWEARRLWGDIINGSRMWANHVVNMIYREDGTVDIEVRRELIERHLAWVNAVAFQLRSTSRLKESTKTRIFNHRRKFDRSDFHQMPDCYRRYLSPQEAEEIERYANPAVHLLRRQGDRLRDLVQQGLLDGYRHVQMMIHLDIFFTAQGSCERIKNTPFPRQVANFGLAFTWVFVIMLPLAFVDLFETEVESHQITGLLAHEFVVTLVPFSILISWIFFLMEKVSDSVEDPFEGGVTDVPISALCRVIEIDLKQILDAEDVLHPIEPVEGVLY